MELFALLADFLKGITAWLPRPFLVNVTQRAVRFRRGQDAALVEPGFRWYTPLFSSVEVYSILQDATEFDPVVLPTSDNKPLAVGFVILWHLEPEDVVTAATSVDDLEAIVGEVGESLLPPLILAHTAAELAKRIRGDRGAITINKKLTEDAQTLLEPYGVTVDSARINTLAPARTIRLIN